MVDILDGFYGDYCFLPKLFLGGDDFLGGLLTPDYYFLTDN